MKKNILLVHSLLILPLVSSSILLSSEKPTKGTQLGQLGYPLKDSGSHKKPKKPSKRAPAKLNASQEQTKQTELALSQETIQLETAPAPIIETAPAIADTPEITPAAETSVIIHETEDAPAVHGPAPKPSVIPTEETVRARLASVLSTLTAKKDETIETIIEVTATPVQTVDPLAASVYQPTPAVKQGLGWGEWAKSKISSTWFALDAIKAKTFDPENTDHMKGLMTAAEQLVLKSDSDGLRELLEACRANYPNIELKKKVALQIQKRFAVDKATATEEYTKSIASETAKLMAAREAIFSQSAELIVALTKQLEERAQELAKAEVAYGLATSKIIEAQNKKTKDAIDSTTVLYKLRRDISTEPKFSSEYLNVLKTIDATREDIGKSFEGFNNVNDAIKTTVSLLATPAKTDILALDNK